MGQIAGRAGGPEDAVWRFHQPEWGYRFTEDALVLARFVDLAGARRAADFGAGCGVVGLSVLTGGRAPALERLFFVEIAPGSAAALALNLALHRPRAGVALELLQADWRRLTPDDFGGRLDYVFANPPYFPRRSGRPSARPEVEAARREIHGGLAELVDSLARVLRPGGRAALMLPPRRRAELEDCLAVRGFKVRRRAEETPRAAGAGPRLSLVEAVLTAA